MNCNRIKNIAVERLLHQGLFKQAKILSKATLAIQESARSSDTTIAYGCKLVVGRNDYITLDMNEDFIRDIYRTLRATLCVYPWKAKPETRRALATLRVHQKSFWPGRQSGSLVMAPAERTGAHLQTDRKLSQQSVRLIPVVDSAAV